MNGVGADSNIEKFPAFVGSGSYPVGGGKWHQRGRKDGGRVTQRNFEAK